MFPDNYKIRYYKNNVRLDPKKLSPTDARHFINMIRGEERRLHLLYKSYLNEKEVVVSFPNERFKKTSEVFFKKSEFESVFDIIFALQEKGELKFDFTIIVNEQEVSIQGARGLPLDHVSTIVVKKNEKV